MDNEESMHQFQTVKAKPVTLKDNYKFFPTNKVYRFFSKITIYLSILFYLFFVLRIVLGLKVKGKKNYKLFKKNGGIMVSNHVLQLDGVFHATFFRGKKVWITMLQSNLGLPFGFGKYIRIGGGVPIPESRPMLEKFNVQLEDALKRKEIILVFPEAALLPYCDHIRPFKKGAFRFACKGNKPILPMVWTYRKPKGLRKLFRKKPLYTLNILDPYYYEELENTSKTILKAMNDVHKIMEDYFNEHSEVKKENK